MKDTGGSARKYAKAKELVLQCWARFINETVRFANKPITKTEPESPTDRATGRTTLATTVIAFFTLVLAVVGYLQYIELRNSSVESSGQMDQMIHESRTQVEQMRRQAGDTHDLAGQMREQATHTKTIAAQALVQAQAAKALAAQAKRSADLSDKTLASDRAWVGVDSFSINSFESNKLVRVRVIETNRGRTPALAVKTGILGGDLIDSSASDDAIKSFLALRSRGIEMRPSTVIAPEGIGTLDMGSPNPLADTEFNLVKSGKSIYFILGRTEYVDVSTRSQWMTFCLYIHYRDGVPVISYCAVGNDMSYQQ